MTYDEINQLLSPLINNPENSDFEIKVTFNRHEDVTTLNGEFTVVFESNIHPRLGNFFMGHTFKLDLDHIRLKLKSKVEEGVTSLPDFNKIEIIQHFASEIALKYSEFKDWIYCHNKSGDDYNKIIEFIIRKKGAIMGRVYGI